jgi:hypothetical protein
MPVHVVLDERLGLLGAARIAEAPQSGEGPDAMIGSHARG